MSIIIPGSFPARRLRRSRTHSFSRRLVAENQLTVNDLILPVFIIEGQNLRQEVPSMPGVFRLSVDMLLHDAAQFVQAGIPAIALFPCIESSAKSLMADASWDPSGLVPRTVRALKKAFPELGVITDVALDAYIRSRSCAEQNEGLAYTTRVNCAETTITLCADSISALNVRYVKYAQETIL
ncbi:hypothetical protein [Klebsiella pneumoniae]|uniref:hypothetical protein n=1 Tax=Klebsiella pneumoniae TaxID=573 RepID=UPI0038B9E912